MKSRHKANTLQWQNRGSTNLLSTAPSLSTQNIKPDMIKLVNAFIEMYAVAVIYPTIISHTFVSGTEGGNVTMLWGNEIYTDKNVNANRRGRIINYLRHRAYLLTERYQ